MVCEKYEYEYNEWFEKKMFCRCSNTGADFRKVIFLEIIKNRKENNLLIRLRWLIQEWGAISQAWQFIGSCTNSQSRKFAMKKVY